MIFFCLLVAGLLIYPGMLVTTKPWKFGLALCDADSWGKAWVDQNGNGYRDPGEPGLEGVCMWDSFRLEVLDEEEVSRLCEGSRTDETGSWAGGFKPGASCDEIHIYAVPPEGYRAITALVANGCSGEFGFAPLESLGGGDEGAYSQYREAVSRARWRQALGHVAGVLIIVGEVALAAVVSGRMVRSPDERRGMG